MIEQGQRLRFPLESRNALRIGRERLRKFFQRGDTI